MRNVVAIKVEVWLRQALLLVAALAFVYVALPRATVTRWICEGRVCGISFGATPDCCCDAPDALRHDGCSNSRRDLATTGDAIDCADGCGCVLVSTAVRGSDHEPHDHTPPPGVPLFEPTNFVAILATPVAGYVPPALMEAVVCNIDTRGPPLWQIPPPCPGLRAPPSA
ncbi:MAG: hypothetical protein H8F28_05330 [Fibrella sp.]|nr:hypothetical protein [Armatimonadota bacterium]